MVAAVVGIDVGTTATKVVVCGLDGVILDSGALAATVDSSSAGHAEMNPYQWWRNICQLLPGLLAFSSVHPAEVAAVGVSGSVPTLVAVDADNAVCYPSIQQNDARAVVEIDELRVDIPDALARTGSSITAQSIGPKWMWLNRHCPQRIATAKTILGSYGWVVAELTGTAVADENWALESGLAALGGTWDPALYGPAGIDPDLLPSIVPSRSVVGRVTAAAAAATGLVAGTPVTAGCADHVISAYSAGLLDAGDTLLKLGGAGDILTVSDEAVVDARLFLDHHPVAGKWMPNGCMATSGALLRWFQRELAGGRALIDLDKDAEAVGPGAGGVLALPYFLGEKTPLQDPLARGVFAGLHLGHTRAHLYRAALEGVVFGFVHHVEVMEEIGLRLTRLVVTNGGSRSALWKQSLADALGRPVASLAGHPGSSWGAALLAIGAIGAADADALVKDHAVIDEWFEPDAAANKVLTQQYQHFRQLQHSVEGVSHALAREDFS